MTPPQPLYIGNMVCDRCLTAVESTLRELGWTVTEVALGRVLAHPPPGGGDDDARQLSELDARLRRLGFELHDAKAGTIDRIKGLIIQYVYNDAADPNLTLSELLSGQLHREYSHLSRQFSAAEGRTVEDFYRAHRMELAKRLLSRGDAPVYEVAQRLHYASASHFSGVFRKATGLTPTAFQKQGHYRPELIERV